MASHLSSIGFPASSEDELLELSRAAAESATEVRVKRGSYLRWRSDSGAELWLQLDRRRDLIGLTPHFSGHSSIRVRVDSRVERPDQSELDGAFHAWADPADDEAESGAYPFVFDCPDFQVYHDLQLGTVAVAQIAAFAHEVSFSASEEDFNREQETEMKFASKSFIPAGLFSPEGGETAPPESLAILTGVVTHAAEVSNPLTGRAFWTAAVDSYGGSFDVVIDPEVLATPPEPGGILSGSFWLSGRLREYAQKRSLLGKLFRKHSA